MKHPFVLTFLLLAATTLSAQPLMKRIPGGTSRLGGGYQYTIQDYRIVLATPDTAFARINSANPTIGEIPAPNNLSRQVTVADFYLAETEVTNQQYRTFLLDSILKGADHTAFLATLKRAAKDSIQALQQTWASLFAKAKPLGLLPYQECWNTDFPNAFNDPLVDSYLWHPAFDNYPVVGVSWEQANHYCEWLTRSTNAQLQAKGKPLQPNFRLPTEAEWEYAAYGLLPSTDPNSIPEQRIFPWPGSDLRDPKGQYRANVKPSPGNYSSDGYEFTTPVKALPPNGFGLYAMAGNVSEWTMDTYRLRTNASFEEQVNALRKPPSRFSDRNPLPTEHLRVIKGGSWADYQYAAYCGSRAGLSQSQGYSRVGFRVAQTIMGTPKP